MKTRGWNNYKTRGRPSGKSKKEEGKEEEEEEEEEKTKKTTLGNRRKTSRGLVKMKGKKAHIQKRILKNTYS